MATAIEAIERKTKEAVWQEPYRNSETILLAAYFEWGTQMLAYSLKTHGLRLFRSPATGNYLVETQSSDGSIRRIPFFPNQLLGVVTHTNYRHKLP